MIVPCFGAIAFFGLFGPAFPSDNEWARKFSIHPKNKQRLGARVYGARRENYAWARLCQYGCALRLLVLESNCLYDEIQESAERLPDKTVFLRSLTSPLWVSGRATAPPVVVQSVASHDSLRIGQSKRFPSPNKIAGFHDRRQHVKTI
jgi:hypothetical protein